MDTFNYDIELPSTGVRSSCGFQFEVEGLLIHSLSNSIAVANAGGADQLRLGYRVYGNVSRATQKFEGRARFAATLLEPANSYCFQITIPSTALKAQPCLLVVEFLYEDQFWFSERGGTPFIFTLKLDDARLAIAPTNRRGPATGLASLGSAKQERQLSKQSPDLLGAVAESVRAIATKYGPVIAVEFAYQYILGRRADPVGLVEKSRLLSEYKLSIEDVCVQMLTCEEYQARAVLLFRDPFVVIKSWAEIDNG